MTKTPELTLELCAEETRRITFSPSRFIIAGWTGRDKAAMNKHIDELEELGVARPAETPMFYRASTSRLTQEELLQNPGENSSGEVEFVIFNIDGDWWIGAGSDHTDRHVEAYNITVSKQMCDKPVARQLWRYDDLKERWDSLEISSHATIGGERVVYQDGNVAAMLHPQDLVAAFEASTGTKFGPGDVMMGGTLAAIGGVRPAEAFEFLLRDPQTGRSISHGYSVETLPVVG